jgi:hypothetical protein
MPFGDHDLLEIEGKYFNYPHWRTMPDCPACARVVVVSRGMIRTMGVDHGTLSDCITKHLRLKWGTVWEEMGGLADGRRR